MKKKFILFALILSVLCIGGGKINSLNAQETILTLGDTNEAPSFNNSTANYPITAGYAGTSDYSISQQIYTAAELNNYGVGNISAIGLKKATTKNYTRNVSIYLKNTDKTDLSEGAIAFDSNDLFYTGTINTGVNNVGDWITITLSKNFLYDGTNIMFVMVEHGTGGLGYGAEKFYYFASTSNSLLHKSSSNSIDINSSPLTGANSSSNKSSVKFTISPAQLAAEVQVTPEFIDFGNVKIGDNYWTEKGEAKVPVTIKAIATKITDISIDNDFFKLPQNIDLSANNIEFDLTCDVANGESKEYTATLFVRYEGSDVPATVEVTATAYIPADGDVLELAPVVDLSTGTFNSGEVTGMYDDYILPGETVDGNLNDAVYKFTLDKDALITATVEGTNPIVAIYDEDFGEKDGPSFDNNDNGIVSGPSAPTTFFYDFSDGSLDDFTLIDADEYKWTIESESLFSYSWKSGVGSINADNYIYTKQAYNITESSKLTYKVCGVSGNDDYYAVVILEDGKEPVKVFEENVAAGEKTKTVNLSEYAGKTVYIGLHHKDINKYYVQIDNLQLTDGSKSRTRGAQIDGVQYPAGIYYLVAAAEGNFTLNLRKVDYIAIDAPQVVGGGSTLNKYVGEPVTLEWSTVEGVDGYRVYKGEDVLAEIDVEVEEINNYTTVLQDYNVTPGYTFYVTAYIGENESPKSEPIYVKVSGDVNINGTLTNGAGATLTFTGTDEFGQAQTYTTIVGNNGLYTIDGINAGHYTMTASKFDYQDFSAEIDIVYSVESVTLEHAMVEKPAAGKAIYSVSMSETQSGATVRWSSNFSSANYNQKYNIYRKDVENGDVTPIVENQTLSNGWDGSYADATYSSLPDGKSYQYGVTAMVEGEPVKVMNEGFTSGIPNTWSYTGSWNSYSNLIAIYPYKLGNVYTLTTPTIDLSGYDLSSLRFDYSTKNDIIVKVQRDGEQNWEPLKTINAQTTQQMVTSGDLNLDTYAGERIKIRFEITAQAIYDYTTTIDNVIVSTSVYSESKAVWSTPLKKGLNIFTGTGNWDDATKWSKGLPTAESEVLISGSVTIPNGSNVTVQSVTINSGYDKLLTISNGASLTVTGSLECTAQNLLISDGGQLFQTNPNVQASFNMSIVNPTEWSENNINGWQFIASPFIETKDNNNIGSFANIYYDYDLYKYDGLQDKEWLNHKAQNFASFESGVGYLASQKDRESVNFIGTLNNKTSHTFEVSYTDKKDLANFHLLGNPFAFNMDWENVDLTNVYDGFATVDPATGGYIKSVVSGVTTIPVGDGFFVETIGVEPSISYNAGSKSRGEEKIDYINVIATGAEGSNNLIVKFSGAEEKGFSKLENINPNIADIYVVNNGRQYSILGYDRDVQEIALNFDAKQMGNYSISLDINGKFETVTLVDRFTGIETNMLIEDEYSFTATSNDSHERFIIRLGNGQQPTAESQFVFQSGEELILSIEGTVQIVDMLGRVVYSNDHSNGNNRISVSEFNNAAYVVRVINEEGVKVQKVVIY